MIDYQNKAINNAKVSIEGASLKTFSNHSGYFELSIPKELFPNVINLNEEIIFKAKDALHTPNQTLLYRKFVQRELVVLTLLPLQSLNIISDKPLEKTVLTDNGALKISMPANSYLDEGGKPYNGEVKIKIGHLDADDPSQLNGFSSFKGKTLSSEDVLIESKNAVFIDIKDKNNRSLNINGNSAYVDIPIGQNIQGCSLWHLKGNQKIWTEINPNVIIKAGNIASIPIHNGGWYNVNRPIPVSVFNGTTKPYSKVEAEGFDYNNRIHTYSDKFGNFSLPVHSKGNFSIKTTQLEENLKCDGISLGPLGIIEEKNKSYGPFNVSQKFTHQELKQDKKAIFNERRKSVTKQKDMDDLISFTKDSGSVNNTKSKSLLKTINENISDPKIKEIAKEVKFKIVSNTIDPLNSIPKKLVGIEEGKVTGFYDVLELDQKSVKMEFTNEKADNVQVNLDINGKVNSENILMLSKNGNIIKPSKENNAKSVFISDETKTSIDAPEMGVPVMKMILDSQGNTGFVQKSDFMNVNKNLDEDLIKKDSMTNFKISIFCFYQDEGPIYKDMVIVMKEKGFTVDVFDTIPQNLDQILQNSNILIVISGYENTLNQFQINSIINYFNNGGSLYILGDNDPLFGEANQLLKPLFNTELIGDAPGDKFLNPSTYPNGIGFDQNHCIFSGINKLYEGVTVCYIENNNYQNLLPIMIGSDGKAIILCYENGKKRAVIDGGFTRMCYRWNESSTNNRRFVINVVGWLSKLDMFF